MGKAQVGQVQVEAPRVGTSCHREVALVGVSEEEGQEADLEVDLGEGQEVGLVVVLEFKVRVKVLPWSPGIPSVPQNGGASGSGPGGVPGMGGACI